MDPLNQKSNDSKESTYEEFKEVPKSKLPENIELILDDIFNQYKNINHMERVDLTAQNSLFNNEENQYLSIYIK